MYKSLYTHLVRARGLSVVPKNSSLLKNESTIAKLPAKGKLERKTLTLARNVSSVQSFDQKKFKAKKKKKEQVFRNRNILESYVNSARQCYNIFVRHKLNESSKSTEYVNQFLDSNQILNNYDRVQKVIKKIHKQPIKNKRYVMRPSMTNIRDLYKKASLDENEMKKKATYPTKNLRVAMPVLRSAPDLSRKGSKTYRSRWPAKRKKFSMDDLVQRIMERSGERAADEEVESLRSTAASYVRRADAQEQCSHQEDSLGSITEDLPPQKPKSQVRSVVTMADDSAKSAAVTSQIQNVLQLKNQMKIRSVKAKRAEKKVEPPAAKAEEEKEPEDCRCAHVKMSSFDTDLSQLKRLLGHLNIPMVSGTDEGKPFYQKLIKKTRTVKSMEPDSVEESVSDKPNAMDLFRKVKRSSSRPKKTWEHVEVKSTSTRNNEPAEYMDDLTVDKTDATSHDADSNYVQVNEENANKIERTSADKTIIPLVAKNEPRTAVKRTKMMQKSLEPKPGRFRFDLSKSEYKADKKRVASHENPQNAINAKELKVESMMLEAEARQRRLHGHALNQDLRKKRKSPSPLKQTAVETDKVKFTPAMMDEIEDVTRSKYYIVNRNKPFSYLEPDPDYELYSKKFKSWQTQIKKNEKVSDVKGRSQKTSPRDLLVLPSEYGSEDVRSFDKTFKTKVSEDTISQKTPDLELKSTRSSKDEIKSGRSDGRQALLKPKHFGKAKSKVQRMCSQTARGSPDPRKVNKIKIKVAKSSQPTAQTEEFICVARPSGDEQQDVCSCATFRVHEMDAGLDVEVLPANQIPVIRDEQKRERAKKEKDRKQIKKDHVRLPPHRDNPALKLAQNQDLDLVQAVKFIKQEIQSTNETLKELANKIIATKSERMGFQQAPAAEIAAGEAAHDLPRRQHRYPAPSSDSSRATVGAAASTEEGSEDFYRFIMNARQQRLAFEHEMQRRRTDAQRERQVQEELMAQDADGLCEKILLQSSGKPIFTLPVKKVASPGHIETGYPSWTKTEVVGVEPKSVEITQETYDTGKEMSTAMGPIAEVQEEETVAPVTKDLAPPAKPQDEEGVASEKQDLSAVTSPHVEEVVTPESQDEAIVMSPITEERHEEVVAAEPQDYAGTSNMLPKEQPEVPKTAAQKDVESTADILKEVLGNIEPQPQAEQKLEVAEATETLTFIEPPLETTEPSLDGPATFNVVLESRETGDTAETELVKVSVYDQRTRDYLNNILKIEASVDFKGDSDPMSYQTTYENQELTLRPLNEAAVSSEAGSGLLRRCMSLPNLQLKIYESPPGSKVPPSSSCTTVQIKKTHCSDSLMELQVVDETLQRYINDIKMVQARIVLKDSQKVKTGPGGAAVLTGGFNFSMDKGKKFHTESPRNSSKSLRKPAESTPNFSKKMSTYRDDDPPKGRKDDDKAGKRLQQAEDEDDTPLTIRQVIQRIEENLSSAAKEVMQQEHDKGKASLKKILDDPLIKISPPKETVGHSVRQLINDMGDTPSRCKDMALVEDIVKEAKLYMEERVKTKENLVCSHERVVKDRTKEEEIEIFIKPRKKTVEESKKVSLPVKISSTIQKPKGAENEAEEFLDCNDCSEHNCQKFQECKKVLTAKHFDTDQDIKQFDVENEFKEKFLDCSEVSTPKSPENFRDCGDVSPPRSLPRKMETPSRLTDTFLDCSEVLTTKIHDDGKVLSPQVQTEMPQDKEVIIETLQDIDEALHKTTQELESSQLHSKNTQENEVEISEGTFQDDKDVLSSELQTKNAEENKVEMEIALSPVENEASKFEKYTKRLTVKHPHEILEEKEVRQENFAEKVHSCLCEKMEENLVAAAENPEALEALGVQETEKEVEGAPLVSEEQPEILKTEEKHEDKASDATVEEILPFKRESMLRLGNKNMPQKDLLIGETVSVASKEVDCKELVEMLERQKGIEAIEEQKLAESSQPSSSNTTEAAAAAPENRDIEKEALKLLEQCMKMDEDPHAKELALKSLEAIKDLDKTEGGELLDARKCLRLQMAKPEKDPKAVRAPDEAAGGLPRAVQAAAAAAGGRAAGEAGEKVVVYENRCPPAGAHPSNGPAQTEPVSDADIVNRDAMNDDLFFESRLAEFLKKRDEIMAKDGKSSSKKGGKNKENDKEKRPNYKYMIPRLRYVILKDKSSADYANAAVVNVTKNPEHFNGDKFFKVSKNGKVMYINRKVKERYEEKIMRAKRHSPKNHCEKIYCPPCQNVHEKAMQTPFANGSRDDLSLEERKPGEPDAEGVRELEMLQKRSQHAFVSKKAKPPRKNSGRDNSGSSKDTLLSFDMGSETPRPETVDIIRRLEEKLQDTVTERKKLNDKKMINIDMGTMLEKIEECKKKRDVKRVKDKDLKNKP